jgi:hypothetical protein
VIVKSYEDDKGESLKWHGKPITQENIRELPDEFLWNAFTKSVPVWQDPTRPESGPSLQSVEASAGESQSETTTPSETSD